MRSQRRCRTQRSRYAARTDDERGSRAEQESRARPCGTGAVARGIRVVDVQLPGYDTPRLWTSRPMRYLPGHVPRRRVHLTRSPRGVWRLRITLDANYPEHRRRMRARRRGDSHRARPDVLTATRLPSQSKSSSHWKHWDCLIPQHGPGRKHDASDRPRPTGSERIVVRDCPEPFLRGLIHSDGTRIIATERKGTYVRRASAVRILEPLRGHPRAVPRRVRGGGRPLHAVERQADLGLQQGSGCAARRVRRPESTPEPERTWHVGPA